MKVDVALAYGLPSTLWAAMLVAPGLGHYWVLAIAGFQLIYFLARPTPQRAVWVLLSYLFSVGGSQMSIYDNALQSVPGWATWLSYVIIPLAAAATLLRRRCWRGRGIVLALIALAFLSAADALMHGVSVLNWLGWMLHFLRYPLLCLALINAGIDKSTYQEWLRAFVGLALLQIPATMVQFVVSGADVGNDLIVGTMFGAQTGIMGLTVVIAFCAALGQALMADRSILIIAAVFSLFIPLVLGAAGFPLGVGIVLAVYLFVVWGVIVRSSTTGRFGSVKVKRKLALLVAFGGLVALAGIRIALTMFPSGTFEFADWLTGSTPTLTSSRAFTQPGYAALGSRQMFIATTVQWFKANPGELLLGSIGPQLGLGQQSETVEALFGGDPAGVPLSRINAAAGLAPTVPQFSVQLPRTLLEVGLVGLLGFALLFWQPRNAGGRASGTSERDAWLRGQVLAFRAIWLLYVVLGMLYLDIWRLDQPSFAFWLWAAALFACERTRHGEGTPTQTLAGPSVAIH